MVKKLLIADDNTSHLKFLGKLLSKHSFQVLVATSIEQTAAIAIVKNPDMIIAGFKNHSALNKLLKSKKETATIPTLLILDKTVKGLVSEHLLRPFSVHHLLEKINASNNSAKSFAPKQLTLMVVDDIAINTVLIEDFLKETPFVTVVKSYGGKDSLDKIQKHSIDLILLDIEMPEINGWETMEMYKKAKITIPVWALTGHSKDDLEDKCREKGFEGIITKPVDKNQLINILSRYSRSSPIKKSSRAKTKTSQSKQTGYSKYIDLTNLERLTEDDKGLREETIHGFLKNIDLLVGYFKNQKMKYLANEKFQRELHSFVNLSSYFCKQLIVTKAKKLQHQIKTAPESVSKENVSAFSDMLSGISKALLLLMGA